MSAVEADAGSAKNVAEGAEGEQTSFAAGSSGAPASAAAESLEQEAAVVEVRQHRPGKVPRAPTQRELDEHLPLHVQYRDWCPICVKAAGVHDQHRRQQEKEESIGVTVSLDYCFFGIDAGEEEEEQQPGSVKTLVMHDDSLDILWAAQVKQKGVSDEVVAWVLNKLEEAGHSGTHITLKSDQEEALMALKRAVAARRTARTSLIESQVRVSKSNPRVERAIRKWREQFRKLKLELEAKISMRVDKSHPMIPWLAAWAGDVLLKYEVKNTGRTGYEQMTGHKVKHKVFGFGEYVHFKLATDNSNVDKFDGEWQDGYFAGVVTRSSEYLAIQGDRVFKCPTMRSRSDGERYPVTVLENMRADYFEYVRKGASTRKVEVLREDLQGREAPRPQPREYAPRRLYLRRADLEEHGYTVGCPACVWLQTGLGFRGPHSQECRERVEGAIRETEEGGARIEKRTGRINQWNASKDPDTEDANMEAEAAKGRGGVEGGAAAGQAESQGAADVETAGIASADAGAMGGEQRDEATQSMEVGSVDRRDEVAIMKHLMGVGSANVRHSTIAEKFSSSLSIKDGWDFTRKSDRRRAWKRVIEEEPVLIIGSPPHAPFAILQQLDGATRRDDKEWVSRHRRRWGEAVAHLEFCIRLYRHQLSQGRHFVHEHPWTSSSWNTKAIVDFAEDPRVLWTRADKCMHGFVNYASEWRTLPTQEATGLWTSSWAIADELSQRSSGEHAGQQLQGTPPGKAVVYPEALQWSVFRGLVIQTVYDNGGIAIARARAQGELCNIMKAAGVAERTDGAIPSHWEDTIHEEDGGHDRSGDRPQDGRDMLKQGMSVLHETGGQRTAWDDVTGAALDVEGVKKARETEMKFFKDMNAYTRCPRECVEKEGGKIIDLKWIDINKGDATNPNYRSRLVGREYNTHKDNAMYAATPPLEALRLILSFAASVSEDGAHRELMVNDVSRAYFYAAVRRSLFIELPPEDEEARAGEVGRLNVCLYGTRDAAKSWQQDLSDHLISIGFKRGKGFPAVFYHPVWGIKTLVHGDDYFSAGSGKALDWLEKQLSAKYQIKTSRVRNAMGDESEARVLNRVVRMTESGYEIEGD